MLRSVPTGRHDDPVRFIRRTLLLGGILLLWMLVIIGRLYQLQIIQYAEWLNRAQRQQQRTVEISAQRGTIFDRHLQPLAMSVAVDSIFAMPIQIPDRAMVASLLAPILGLDAADLNGRFNAYKTFCWVKRKVAPEEAARVAALNLAGIYFRKEMKRFYPKGDLAADVLGYVGLDDKGLAGLEYAMDGTIQGTPSRWLVDEDARRQTFRSSEWKGEPGKNVVLTLDENIQNLTQEALAEGVKKWRAAGGAAIVQNPSTGEILAMASEPTFDPNRYERASPPERLNRGIAWVYEPGSTFKLITVAAALDVGVARPSDVIDCQMGSIVLAGRTIHDHEPLGAVTVDQVMVHSSDVGAVKIALRLGEDRFYRYIRDFGFGSRTEVGLPGEEHGLLEPPRHWSGVSIGELAIGQGIGVTALQLINAYSAIANGGVMIQPRIVRDIFREGTHEAIPPARGRRVVSEQTAEEMKAMLEHVVEQGTGRTAQLAGYTAAGKTGTAQKVDPSGRYSHTHYVASFVGMAPVDHPAITVLVSVDTPVGAYYGQEVAAPVFKTIAEKTLAYLNVPQDKSAPSPLIASSLTPAPSCRLRRGKAAGVPPSSPTPSVAEQVRVEAVSYAPQEPAARGTVMLNTGPLVVVPDFTGRAERQTVNECERLGLDLNVAGSGLAVEQRPPAGTRLPAGSRIWVRFSR